MSLNPNEPDLLDSMIKFVVGAALIIGWLVLVLHLESKPPTIEAIRKQYSGASVIQK